MLSTEDVKRLLQDRELADDEALAIRDACYELAAIIVAQWRYKGMRTNDCDERDGHVTNGDLRL